MKHVERKDIEESVAKTLERLKKVSEIADEEVKVEHTLNVLSRHFSRIGQHELAEHLDDMVIGYTNPTADVKAAS